VSFDSSPSADGFQGEDNSITALDYRLEDQSPRCPSRRSGWPGNARHDYFFATAMKEGV
jgi:hypothetical protein